MSVPTKMMKVWPLAIATVLFALCCVVLAVDKECVLYEQCRDGNSCTYDICDNKLCTNPSIYPAPDGCCLYSKKECKGYCTQHGYQCVNFRCECVPGDRDRIDDSDPSFMEPPLVMSDTQLDMTPIDDGMETETMGNQGGDEGTVDWVDQVPWVAIGGVGLVALLVVICCMLVTVIGALVFLRSRKKWHTLIEIRKKRPGARRYTNNSINDTFDDHAPALGDDLYYNEDDL